MSPDAVVERFAIDSPIYAARSVWDLTRQQVELLNEWRHLNEYVYAALVTVHDGAWPRDGVVKLRADRAVDASVRGAVDALLTHVPMGCGRHPEQLASARRGHAATGRTRTRGWLNTMSIAASQRSLNASARI